MKKIITVSIFFLQAVFSFSQTADDDSRKAFEQFFYENNTNKVYYAFQYTDVKGSPFLSDKWMRGRLVLDDQTRFDNLQMKFDQYSNKFIINWRDTAFQISPVVKQIDLFPTGDTTNKMIFKNGYAINDKINTQTYLQVLAEGKATFLRYLKKEMDDYTEYGDATKYKRFEEVDRYFVFVGGEFKTVLLNKKSLQDVLPDKWTAVSDYLTTNKVNVKDEEGWKLAIQYYNSL